MQAAVPDSKAPLLEPAMIKTMTSTKGSPKIYKGNLLIFSRVLKSFTKKNVGDDGRTFAARNDDDGIEESSLYNRVLSFARSALKAYSTNEEGK